VKNDGFKLFLSDNTKFKVNIKENNIYIINKKIIILRSQNYLDGKILIKNN